MDDYVRYPKDYRGDAAMVKLWRQCTADGGWALNEVELAWRSRSQFLLANGYELRPRFREGWTPSWTGTDINPWWMEDSIRLYSTQKVLDATRISDGMMVGIKPLNDLASAPNEVEITRFLSTEALRRDPHNHCIELLDVLRNPAEPQFIFIVEPWVEHFNYPDFCTSSEVVDFVKQTLEGLAFMHQHGVAHRDCTGPNIRMDASTLFQGVDRHPSRMHATRDATRLMDFGTRHRGAVRYVYIDFGMSAKFHSSDWSHLVLGDHGRDQDVPELSDTVAYDAFAADVFILGNVYQKDLLDKFQGLDWLRPLVSAMTAFDPRMRPTAAAALTLFRARSGGAKTPVLALRLRPRGEAPLITMICGSYVLVSELLYQIWSLLSCLWRSWRTCSKEISL